MLRIKQSFFSSYFLARYFRKGSLNSKIYNNNAVELELTSTKAKTAYLRSAPHNIIRTSRDIYLRCISVWLFWNTALPLHMAVANGDGSWWPFCKAQRRLWPTMTTETAADREIGTVFIFSSTCFFLLLFFELFIYYFRQPSTRRMCLLHNSFSKLRPDRPSQQENHEMPKKNQTRCKGREWTKPVPTTKSCTLQREMHCTNVLNEKKTHTHSQSAWFKMAAAFISKSKHVLYLICIGRNLIFNALQFSKNHL